MIKIPTKKLNERAMIPILGLGTANLHGSDLRDSLLWGFDLGYRHIDTADLYNNQKEIGDFIKTSGVERDELFITSKVWSTDLAEEDVKTVTNKTLEELQTNYIDLMLIHSPNPNIPIAETLQTLKELQNKSVINAIGISNFDKQQVKEVLEVEQNWKTSFKIKNNQIEYHLEKKPNDLVQYCYENNITVTAYSPFAEGNSIQNPVVKQIANKHGKTSPQVVLRWLVQKGMIVIPRSSTFDHLKENIEIFDWKLTDDDINRIDEPSVKVNASNI